MLTSTAVTSLCHCHCRTCRLYHCRYVFDVLLGDSRVETDEREKLVGVIGLYILHYHLFHVVDKKTFKLLWELHKKVGVSYCL